MSTDLTILLAFTTGIAGAFHCLGMCTGLAGGLFARREWTGLTPILTYHGARILTYTLLGVAGAAVGRVLVLTGMIGKAQGLLMILAGLLIVLVGLRLLLATATPPASAAGGVAVAIPTPKVRGPAHWAPAAGVLNGLIPCSLVFSVAVKAAATADPLRAGMLMLAFGLGTLPTMAAVSLAGAAIGARTRELVARLGGLLVIVLGLWTLYEGYSFFHVMRGLGNW
ncbi:MAG: sulfite exporter TauE/SafE family protein [Chromatiaceae bacterium]|nr:sulfite exporter TauE/SafE family protein [Chromatiaceae bacterium]